LDKFTAIMKVLGKTGIWIHPYPNEIRAWWFKPHRSFIVKKAILRFLNHYMSISGFGGFGRLEVRIDKEAYKMMTEMLSLDLRSKKKREILAKYARNMISLREAYELLQPFLVAKRLKR